MGGEDVSASDGGADDEGDDVGVSGAAGVSRTAGTRHECRSVGFGDFWRTGCCQDQKKSCS